MCNVVHRVGLCNTLCKAFFLGLSLLGASDPHRRIDLFLDRLRKSLGLERRLGYLVEGIQRIDIARQAIVEQVRHDFGTGIQGLRVTADLHTITIGKLTRTSSKAFVRHLFKNLFVCACGVVSRKFTAINLFNFALLHHLLDGSQIAGINGFVEGLLSKNALR